MRPGKSLAFTHPKLLTNTDLKSSWEKYLNKPTNTDKAIAPISYQQSSSSSSATLLRSPPAAPSLSRLNLVSTNGQCRGKHDVYRDHSFLTSYSTAAKNYSRSTRVLPNLFFFMFPPLLNHANKSGNYPSKFVLITSCSIQIGKLVVCGGSVVIKESWALDSFFRSFLSAVVLQRAHPQVPLYSNFPKVLLKSQMQTQSFSLKGILRACLTKLVGWLLRWWV